MINIYAVIVLATILAEYILSLIASVLNLQTLSAPLPDEFRGVCDTASYANIQMYTRTRTRFNLIESAFTMFVVLLFWFLGGFNGMDRLVRGWGWSEIWSGVGYIGILLALRAVCSLPFSVYSTFVIEERFGFNKTTPGVFVFDLLKGLLL